MMILKYWLSKQLPILAEIRAVLAAQLAYVSINTCDCNSAQNYIDQQDRTQFGKHLAIKLNFQQWCFACKYTPIYIPPDERFYARIFLYSNKWREIYSRCICEYLPAEILSYETCYLERLRGYCHTCDMRHYVERAGGLHDIGI